MKLNKLQLLAKRILDEVLTQDFTLNMICYKNIKECGTSYCLAGYLAMLDNYPKEFRDIVTSDNLIEEEFNYHKYSNSLIDNKMEWSFLFNPLNSNSKEDAKTRCNYILEHGKIPETDWQLHGSF